VTEIVKRCPLCGRGMVVRTNRETGTDFLGCTGWGGDDGCRHTERVPESYRLRQEGHAELPLFGETR
jgi:ssDNA-binding Zn-finger/Zn-ribbon topoisomerase 1